MSGTPNKPMGSLLRTLDTGNTQKLEMLEETTDNKSGGKLNSLVKSIWSEIQATQS